MTLLLSNFSPIQFNEDQITTLEIHCRKLYRATIESFKQYINKKAPQETITFKDNGKLINLCKKIVFCNPGVVSYEKKVIQKKVIEVISKDIIIDYEVFTSLEKSFLTMVDTIDDKISEININLTYDSDYQIESFLKMINLNVNFPEYNILDQLYQYVDIITEFNLYEILIFNNLKEYLTSKELEELFKYLLYKEQRCLLLESTHDDRLYDIENKLIINDNYDDFYM